jgi:signal transduction histidine kinase
MRRKEVHPILQEIGLPAVRVKPVSAEVIEYNELFESLVHAGAPPDYRLWFLEGVLPLVNAADRSRWKTAFAHLTSVQVQVAFKSVRGKDMDFEMRAFSSPDQKKLGRSILCVFIPFATPIFERICQTHRSEGRELERCRIRNELHKDVSQRLLGAAFGCKVLAGKLAKLSEGLGKEATDLAQLVNEAVMELQSLVQSSQNQS